MLQPQRTRLSLIAALFLVTSLAASYIAAADPAVNDNGDGTKTAVWDFSNPANYTSSNVAIAPNDLRLGSTPGAWTDTSDADFATGINPDPNVRITNASLRLNGNERNLVANGNFSTAANWTWTNGTAGTIVASQNLGTGEFAHATADNSTQFDSMDTGLGWSGVTSLGATSTAMLDPLIKHEGTSSMRDTITLPSSAMWAGISRTVATGDFSPYNHLSVWLSTNFSGPGQLQGRLHLETATATWDSLASVVPGAWAAVEFNFTSFGANLSAITRLDLRFTGAVVAGANVYVDDLWRVYTKTISDAAMVSQTFSKPSTGNGQPGSALLWWDYAVSQRSNVTSARLGLVVTNATGSSQSWAADLTGPIGWTSRLMDLSTLLTPAGTYTIRFTFQVSLNTYFATSAIVRIDNVLLKAPDYRDGVYTSRALDAVTPAVWGQLRWTQQVDSETRISVETRSGSTPAPPDPTWSPWRAHPAPEAIGSPDDRFLQFRVLLQTLNSSRTPALLDITLDYFRYVAAGWVETLPFVPTEPLVGWRRFDAVASLPPSTSIRYEIYSNGTWVTVNPGQDLSAFPRTTLQFHASLTTGNTSLSPRIDSMSVMYEYFGPLWTATLTPPSWSGTADAVNVAFTSQGKDRWGHNVSFTPTWETTDPNASIAGGRYNPHTTGTWVVRVRAPSGAILANATVIVTPGALARLDLSPPSATAPAGSQIAFFLTGFDADNNVVGLFATEWSSTGGTFVNENPSAALLRLPGVPGTVNVTARHGSVSTRARVDVTSSGTPVISGTIPDQVHEEDSTWSLDLTAYAANQPNTSHNLGTLKWYLTGKDASLYTVWGENFTGNHVLVFSGQPDAYSSNHARLWLEGATGARTSQSLWVNLTPVNDPPRFGTIPDLPVKAGKAYPFDVEPYITDVDTPPANLTLSTNDPAHVSVAGLNLTLTYPTEDLGRRIYLRLAVSDGDGTARTVVIVDVTSNTPPHVRTPLPDLTFQEDEFRAHAFPQSLSSYFADDDGDDLFFSYGQRDVTVVIWNNSGFWQVDVRPKPNWFGVEKVTFRATDRSHAFAEYSILVTVTSVNDPPEFLPMEDVFVRFDTPYVLDLSAYIRDVDTPLEAVTLQATPTRFIQVHGFTATLLYPRFLLGPNATYDLPAKFYVNDTEPGGSHRIFVHVSDNRPPILQRPLPDVRFDEDTVYAAYRLSIYFSDPDSAAPLSFLVTGVHVKGDIGADTTVTFRTAAPNWFGQEVVFIRAEDAASAFVNVSVLVRVSPVDDAPRFVGRIPDRDLTGGGIVVIDLRNYVTDVDDALENLTFTVEGPYASVYGFILVLDVPAGAESQSVTVTASDGRLSASTSFQVTMYRPTIWAQVYWPWSGLGAVLAAVLLLLAWELFLRFPHTIEDVFIIGREGRLILHNTRRLRADRDEDILAGMLTAIMLFVRDSFREEHEDLKQFEFGDRKVLVERGSHCYIAAIFGGGAPPWARKDLNAFLKEIETRVGDRIAGWSGDRDDVHDLKGMTEEFVRRRRYHRNGGWWPFRARAS